MVTKFSDANLVQVALRWMTKDICSLSPQSEHAFNAIHCFTACIPKSHILSIYLPKIILFAVY